MACETILYEVSGNGVTIAHNRADRLMDREFVKALVPR